MRFIEYRVPALLEHSRRILAIPAKKTDTRLVNYLSGAEMQSLLNVPDLQRRDGIRDRAMLHLCFAAGLRVSELVSLPLKNLDFYPTPSVRILGKGRKERIVPLWKETAADIRAWLAVRGDTPAFELFLNARGLPITRSGFKYILQKHVKTAVQTCASLQEKRVSPHVLRHYLPFLTMSGHVKKSADMFGNRRSHHAKSHWITRHSFLGYRQFRNSVADPEVDADPPCPTVVTSWRAPALHGGLPARSGADETSPDYVTISSRISADNWGGVTLQDIVKKGR
jgi:site-specific recombinase XerC